MNRLLGQQNDTALKKAWKHHYFRKRHSFLCQSSSRSRDTSCTDLWEPEVSYTRECTKQGKYFSMDCSFQGRAVSDLWEQGQMETISECWPKSDTPWESHGWRTCINNSSIHRSYLGHFVNKIMLLGYGASDLGTRRLAQNGYLMIRVIISRGVGSFARHYSWTCTGIMKQTTWNDS